MKRVFASRLAVAAIALVLGCDLALAKDAEEVTVTASRGVVHTPAGRTFTGVPIEQVSLTYRVGYHDLNLANPADVAALAQRVSLAAKRSCTELEQLHPGWRSLPAPSLRQCVRAAMDDATRQLDSAVASSRR